MDPKDLVSLLAQAALFLVVVSFGLQARAHDVLEALRDTSLIFRGVVAVNVVVPVTAVIICSLLSLDPAVETGIIIMAVSPLAPLAPGKMRKGGLKTSTVVGLYVALILLAVLLVPLTIALLGAIFPVDASISVSAVAELVGTTILLPIALGVAVATVAPAFAGAASRIAGAAGMIGVLLLLALIAFVQRGAAAALIGDGTLFAIVVIISAGLLAGHLLGRPDPAYSNALAMAAAIRHPGIAVLIAQANFQDKRVVLAIILFLVVSVIVTTIYQKLTAREAARPGSRAPAG